MAPLDDAFPLLHVGRMQDTLQKAYEVATMVYAPGEQKPSYATLAAKGAFGDNTRKTLDAMLGNGVYGKGIILPTHTNPNVYRPGLDRPQLRPKAFSPEGFSAEVIALQPVYAPTEFAYDRTA